MHYGQANYQYELVDDWANLPEGDSFVDVGGLATDAEDRVYVLNRGLAPVRVFDRNGELLRSWGSSIFDSAHGVCVDKDGYVYCTDDKNHTIRKFASDGQLLLTLGKEGVPSDTGYVRNEKTDSIKRSAGPFNRPTSVAVSDTGEMFVSDGYGNARVHKFDPDGNLVFSWGTPGYRQGQFRQPHSIRMDKLGRLWVCDRDNSRMQIFDQQGRFIDEWSDIGGKPSDVFVDTSGEGLIYIALKTGEKPFGVSIFNGSGRLLSHWGDTEEATTLFWSPHAITVDSRGDIYLGEIRHAMRAQDKGTRALRKFVRLKNS